MVQQLAFWVAFIKGEWTYVKSVHLFSLLLSDGRKPNSDHALVFWLTDWMVISCHQWQRARADQTSAQRPFLKDVVYLNVWSKESHGLGIGKAFIKKRSQ